MGFHKITDEEFRKVYSELSLKERKRPTQKQLAEALGIHEGSIPYWIQKLNYFKKPPKNRLSREELVG